ncbi:MAG TPA: long-chain fatty acid--CoA ligase [Chroococcales cyanobacterium]
MAEETIVQEFWKRASGTAEKPAIMYKCDGQYQKVIWREHGRTVELVAGGLLSLGLQPKDHVAIMSQSRPNWTWADLAILSCAGATVPVYPTLAAPEVQYLVKHSDSVGLFAENAYQAQKILEAPSLPPALRFVVVIDGEPPVDSRVKCMKWDDLMKDGEVYLLNHASELKERIDSIKPSDYASIVYTSGTTGVPKGAIITHGNVHSVCKAICQMVGFFEDDIALSFLPLSHVYERVGGQMLSIYSGLVTAYAESIDMVPKNMVEVKPTVLNGVPRFYEKAYQRIQAEVRNLAPAQQYLIRWSLSLGKRAAKYGATDKSGALMKQFYRGELRVADRLVFSKIRRRFGGRLRVMVSGAAPLSSEVQTFFSTIGLPIVEGYGLTETSAPIACNTPEDNRLGTVGKALPGIEVKIADDGEILVRGPSVFAGYYKNEEASQEAFRDGWFLTGDIGEIDSSGYIKIKDRKKDIIITSGGKHVAPQLIENMFRGEGLISNIVVYGDRRKYITALITLNKDSLKTFAESNNLPTDNIDTLCQNPVVKAEIEAVIGRKNEFLASFERIKKFVILENDFTAENNEITPTFKVKRKAITEKYQAVLDSLYDSSDLEVSAGEHK